MSIIFICITITASSQYIIEDNTDDINGNRVARTTWETLKFEPQGPAAFFSVSCNNGTIYFRLKLTLRWGAESDIEKDAELLFKLDNDSTITLYNLRYDKSEKNKGAKGILGADLHGTLTHYQISQEDIDKIKNNKIVQWRVYTTDRYVESKIREKKYTLIKHSLIMISDYNFSVSDQEKNIEISDNERMLDEVSSGAALNEMLYKDIDEVQIGDVVKYTSPYGDIIYGIVIEKVKKNRPKIKYYSRPGSELFEEVPYKKLTKIILLEKQE